MVTQIQIVAHEGVDEGFLTQIRTWTNEVSERMQWLSPPQCLSITIWRTKDELQAFYQEEKEALGVITAEETDYLATHESWRGYPRIHLCQERMKGIPDAVIRGSIHHEMGHAFHHGRPEFYAFRFSRRLQEAGNVSGLDFPLLQQCVYFLSVAIKDQEVVQYLAERGLGFGQLALLEYLISDTEEECRSWELARNFPGLKKLAFSAFLKTLLPIEAMISVGVKEAHALKSQWKKSYGWLSEEEQEELFHVAQSIMRQKGETFQDRLEQVTLLFISPPST